SELYNHFKKVAESINIQMTLYNIPIFTGVNINPETVAKLSEIDNIVAIKEEAEINPKQMTEFINCTSDDFIIYCGDDSMILEAFVQGGAKRIGGIISGGSHIIGTRLRNMIKMFLGGKVKEAAEMQQNFLPLFRSWGQNGRFNRPMVSSPIIHHRIDIPKSPFTSYNRGKPGGRPGGIGSLI
ncbi:unnamed protein product, partial [marine sediment metagenome]